ncbi:tRNA dimethylallyltransferase [Euwallacea similis]|uniref:tRNA dimethylallyltransferase n=1 Tax=Euwallacea similis TaxID=1736056 RepID=UPI00345090E6
MLASLYTKWGKYLKGATRKMTSKLPLVVILGSTGSGKTKLSLELATKFGGEIVGADSMQIYKGLDVASAKATPQEISTVPHHMINILEPHQMFTVLAYRNMVLPIIEEIFNRGNFPIIVGGTNYYIESILWKILVQNPGEEVIKDCGIFPNKEHELPNEVLHEKLKKLDPVMANRLHPNNRRKVLRSLEVLYQKGKKHSDILEEQCSNSKSGGGLRFKNVIVLWLQCDQVCLDQRLDSRVDNMIQEGLLDELLHFHKEYNEKRLMDGRDSDYSRGIFQSIGFKEFHSYLIMSNSEKESEEGQKILQQAVDQLKIVTRRFSKKQTKWTMNRFLGRRDREVPPIYGLNTTDISKWSENVIQPAVHILESYISETNCNIDPLPMRDTNSVPNTLDETFVCEICNRVFIGTLQWTTHIKSRRHRMVLERKKKQNDEKNSMKNCENLTTEIERVS